MTSILVLQILVTHYQLTANSVFEGIDMSEKGGISHVIKFRWIAVVLHAVAGLDAITLCLCLIYITKITPELQVFDYLWRSMWNAFYIVFWSFFYFFTVNYGLTMAILSIEVGHKAEYSSITLAFVRTITRMVDDDDSSEGNNFHA